MKTLDKIRQLPRAKRISLIWLICIITALILITLWAITAKYIRTTPDTQIFDTLNDGAKDLQENYNKPIPTNLNEFNQ